MNTLRKWTPFAISMLSMTAFSVAITCSVNAQTEKLVLSKTVAHKISSVPGPQSGIKLIEFISARIHSLKGPVIAMAGAKQMYQAPLEQNSGPTDKLLALKPPSRSYVPREESVWEKSAGDEGKSRKKASVVDDRKQDKDKNSLDLESDANARRSSARWDFSPNTWKKDDAIEVSSRPQASPQSSANMMANAYGRQLPDRFKNGPLAKSLANLKGTLMQTDDLMRNNSNKADVVHTRAKAAPRAEASYTVASNNQPTGIWEPSRSPQQSAGSAVSQKATRSLAGATLGTIGEYEETQAQSPPLPAGYYKHQHYTHYSPGDNQYTTNSDGITGGAGGAQIRDYKRGTLLSSNVAAAPAMQASAMVPPPPAASLSSSFALETKEAHVSIPKKTEIAMLPPNVITGIPLVRLGSSALDATKALTSVKGNKLKQQSINGWTVYVLHKANSVEPAMQVYMRHGLVEALRVFDSAFIAPDFGVQLNDDISVVKAKFGEPAFMVAEPDCPSAKNYIYPISQVSFELALPPHASSPKVVSVLIFTVK